LDASVRERTEAFPALRQHHKSRSPSIKTGTYQASDGSICSRLKLKEVLMRMSRKAASVIIGSWLLALSAVAQAAEFNIDPYHSSVSFRVKHVVGKVTGHFEKFSGSFTYDAAKPASWATMATIEAASINTGI